MYVIHEGVKMTSELTLYENIKFPSFVQFESANDCNARCSFCCYADMKRSHTKMPWSLILKIIDESVLHGVQSFCPFLMQEPLLEPRLLSILRNIKQHNSRITTTVYSNMSLMTKDKALEVLEARVIDHLTVSFYAPNKRVYEKLQYPLKYGVVSKNIRRFMRLKKLGGYTSPEVTIHYIAMPPLYRHAKTFMDKWRPIVDSIGFVHYDNWHGDKPKQENDSYWPVNPEKERFPCPRLWHSMQILSNGEVVPCCIDYEALEPMGNVREYSLKEVWNNVAFQHMRRLHVERRFSEIPLCKDCTLWRYQHNSNWNQFWRQTKIPIEVAAE